jgi:serine/threonine protein kinase
VGVREEDFTGTERFAVRRRLGSGGMGVVYEVFDAERRTQVALKTLRKVSGAEIYRLKQEFRTLADVSHPNVVQLHELYARDEQVFFTMELLDGSDFLSWVRNDGGRPIAPAERAAAAAAAMADTIGDPSMLARAAAVSAGKNVPVSVEGRPESEAPIMLSMPTLRLPSHSKARMTRLRDGLRQLAEGVQALHEAGILHRDIKPSNVIVTGDGRVVLLDFGLASPTAQLVTQSDSGVVGTPAYMSPEQGASGPLAPASDWYAIGVILYEALTGRLPFIGRSLQVLMDKQQYEPPAPHEVDPEVPGDLDALCVDLLRTKPEARPIGREVLRRLGSGQIAVEALSSSRSVHSSSRNLVGRDDEKRMLEQAFADSREGRCVVTYVYGASGIGKTALVKRVLDDVETRGDAVVLTGRCYEMESVPFKAFDSLVDALSRHLSRLGSAEVHSLLPRDVPLLARLFPVLLQVNAVADAPRRMAEPPDLQELRRRGFAALRELLQRLTDRRPLVLCIDDLQWGDADSAALLVELLRPPDPPPLLLVGIFRSEQANSGAFARALAPAARESGVAVDVRDITLAPLPHAQARELALRMFGAGPEVSPELFARAESIARESAGSPFFVSELVRHVQAGAELDDRAGAGGDAGGREATLGEFLRARLERLPPEARRLLEVVSVAGTPVQQVLARQAAELSPDGASGRDGAATIALLRAGHLVRTTGVRDLDTIETYHDRIRETMVAGLPAAELVGHHRALAFAFEASGRADPETVALHFRGAGMIDRAAQYTELAAAQAADALAFQWAAVLYRQAIELREQLAAEEAAQKLSTGDRVRLTESLRSLRVALGDALANAGSGPAAALVYLAAAQDGQAADMLEMRRRAAEQYLRSGHLEDGLAVLATVLGAVSARLAVTPRRALVSLVWRRAQVRLRGLGYQERDSTQIAAEALTRVDIFWSVSTALGMVDNIRAADFQSRHLLLALAAGEPYRIARALATEACYASADGARVAARTQRLVARSREIAERSQHPHAIGMAIFAAGFTAVMEGRFHDGAALTREAEDTFRERCRNVAWETTVMQQMNLSALFYTGDLVELGRRVPSLLAQAEERGDLYATSALRTWVANLAWLLDDDVAGARRAIEDTSRAWPKGDGFILQHYWDLHARQHVDLYDGRGEEAYARIVDRWPAMRRSMLLRISALDVDALWQRARAALAAAAASPAGSSQRLRLLSAAAHDAASLSGQPYAPAFRELLLGDVFALRGDHDRALVRFTTAEAELTRLGFALFVTVARRRRAELTSDRPAIHAADAWLTSRSVRVPAKMARLICPGTGSTLPTS